MQQITLSGLGGLELRASHYEVDAPRASLLLLHGFGEHRGRFAELATFLANAGIAVLTFDQRGYGESPGRRGHVERWTDYVADVRTASQVLSDLYPATPQFLLGHSLGGVIALDYLLASELQPRGAIISAPVLGTEAFSAIKVLMSRVLSAVAPRLQVNLGLDSSNLSRIPEVEQEYLADPLVHGKASMRFGSESIDAIHRILDGASGFSSPMLLVYGDDDRVASLPTLDRFYGELTVEDLTRVVYPGGQHESHMDVQKDEVFALYRDWILERV